jgi:hypothetical protein
LVLPFYYTLSHLDEVIRLSLRLYQIMRVG